MRRNSNEAREPLNHWLFLSVATSQAGKAVCRFQTFIELAPFTIPAANHWPFGLIAMVPFPMSGLEQDRFPEESHTPKPSLV
jgi:hypothetical protein